MYFYEPNITQNGNILNEEESYHCLHVLRGKIGDKIVVIDGAGNRFLCKIAAVSRNRCQVIIEAHETSVLPVSKCHIAVAPTKNIDRFEWFIEKSTETGIREITPLICSHSERKVLKYERLEKIVVSAVKQSMSLWKPALNPLLAFKEFVTMPLPAETQKFIAHCGSDDAKVLLKNVCIPHRDTVILIGPEGDFASNEIQLALDNGYRPVSLGNNRLRTETAALVACHTVELINE
ncbi:MAG: 16S rRNA (uracil(1498)-N(3))-methyltransferase [Cytophagaceae bacterium]|jgi:16S rRNA (uracil1498-N3)-methyltransferase|nr:16S rRNA (uracil(1498)-N(3))-methyltransferase [Cytophagaceae bacterium]